jgi:Protein of unknown function (DUF3887)
VGPTHKALVRFGRGAVIVVAGVVLSTSSFLAVTACEKSSTTGQSSTSTSASATATPPPASSTARSSSAPANANYDQAALQLLDAITQGDFAAATANFDTEMRQKLSAQALSQAWAQYQQLYGTYQSHGDPQHVQKGNMTVVDVPLQMQKGPGLFRVTFHDKDGKVAGLFFLKPGTPLP